MIDCRIKTLLVRFVSGLVLVYLALWNVTPAYAHGLIFHTQHVKTSKVAPMSKRHTDAGFPGAHETYAGCHSSVCLQRWRFPEVCHLGDSLSNAVMLN